MERRLVRVVLRAPIVGHDHFWGVSYDHRLHRGSAPKKLVGSPDLSPLIEIKVEAVKFNIDFPVLWVKAIVEVKQTEEGCGIF